MCLLILFSSRQHVMLIFCIARVSRDGRDLVVLSRQHHVIFIRGFERICRGETTFEQAGLVLGIQPEAMCYDLGFEEGRVCVATVRISQALLVVSGVYVGCSFKGSMFSPSAQVFWHRLRSCDLPTPWFSRGRHAAYRSRTTACISRGMIQVVGRTFQCLRTQLMLRTSHHQ